MILIPLHRKPDWSRPPWITVLLIVINLLIFMFYQSDDDEHLTEAVQIYQSQNLLELEEPVYRTFLVERQLTAPVLENEFDFSWQIAFDRDFDRYLLDYWQGLESINTQQLAQWRKARAEFEIERNQISSFAAGLTPSDNRWWTYVTHMFLHGGWEHLIGNMVFLFLFGMTLEMALGPVLYFLLFVFCGIAAGGLHVVLHSASTVPLVGASGAISGLMGMYVSLYGLRQIRFFYTVFFYFGEFRAPAILVLPLWLCKEIYGHFFTDTNIAYMAHFGGLLAGAAVMLPLRRYLVNFQEDEQAHADTDEAAAGLARLHAAVSALDFNRARAIANQLCERYPESAELCRKRFDLAVLAPQALQLDEIMQKSIRQFVAADKAFDSWREELELMLREYSTRSPQTPALDSNSCLALAKKYWRMGWRERAEEFLRLAITKGGATDDIASFIAYCSNEYRRLGNLDKSRYVEALLPSST